MNTRVVVAPLGRRFVAWLTDRVVPAALGVAFVLVNWVWLPDAWLIHDVVLTVLMVAWVMVQWWAYGTRGAGLGYRLTGLQLVRLSDGRPLGWARMCLRTLILQVATALVVPGIILAVMLVIQERRQGWMDLAVGSVCVRRQPRLAPETPTHARSTSPRQVVGLPAHLTQPGFVAPTEAIIPAAPEQPWTPPAGGGSPQSPVEPAIRQAPIHRNPESIPAQPVSATHQMPVRPVGTVPAQPAMSPADPVVPSRPVTSVPRSGAVSPVVDEQTMPASGGATFGAVRRATGSAAPAVPAASPAVAPAPRIRPRQLTDEAEEGTRLVAGPPPLGGDQGWVLRLDDGRQIPLTGTLLIGRDPAPRPTDGPVNLVPAGEPSRTVSKTHLCLGVDARGVFLVDRGSTNGTAVRGPDGELRPCAADQTVRLTDGQVVSFGERTLQIIRRS